MKFFVVNLFKKFQAFGSYSETGGTLLYNITHAIMFITTG